MYNLGANREDGNHFFPAHSELIGGQSVPETILPSALCPECHTPVEVCRVSDGNKFSCQVACSTRPNPHVFLIKSLSEFALFFTNAQKPECVNP